MTDNAPLKAMHQGISNIKKEIGELEERIGIFQSLLMHKQMKFGDSNI